MANRERVGEEGEEGRGGCCPCVAGKITVSEKVLHSVSKYPVFGGTTSRKHGQG